MSCQTSGSHTITAAGTPKAIFIILFTAIFFTAETIKLTMIRRRTLLLLSSSLILGGCMERGLGVAPSTDRVVTVEKSDRIPKTHGFELDVIMENESATPNKPAKLSLQLKNGQNPKEIDFDKKQNDNLLQGSDEFSDPYGLTLFSPDESKENKRKEGKWSENRNPEEDRRWNLQMSISRERYTSDETAGQTYHVWDDFRAEEYFEPGVYRFNTTVRKWDSPSSEEMTLIDWGFSLRVENG